MGQDIVDTVALYPDSGYGVACGLGQEAGCHTARRSISIGLATTVTLTLDPVCADPESAAGLAV